MADQKQDKGTTGTGNPTARGTEQGTTQERNATTPRAADQDRDRDDERGGEPGAAYGTPSSMKESDQRNERGSNTSGGKNDGRIGQAHEGNDKNHQPNPIVAQGDRNEGGKPGMRDEERTGNTTGAAGNRKGDESDAQRTDRKGTERDLH